LIPSPATEEDLEIAQEEAGDGSWREYWESRPRTRPGGPLAFFNGLGGFTEDDREYVIRLDQGMGTPAPWSNVTANNSLGTMISESGGAYTLSENSQPFRLTP
jgi:cellobiose phosphorylase